MYMVSILEIMTMDKYFYTHNIMFVTHPCIKVNRGQHVLFLSHDSKVVVVDRHIPTASGGVYHTSRRVSSFTSSSLAHFSE